MSTHVRFSQLLEKHILEKVQRFAGRVFEKTLLIEVHETVINSLEEIFNKSVNYRLEKKTIQWLGMQYFNALKISDDLHIRDVVLFNEIELNELSYADVKLMSSLFDETVIGPMLDEELDRRNAS